MKSTYSLGVVLELFPKPKRLTLSPSLRLIGCKSPYFIKTTHMICTRFLLYVNPATPPSVTSVSEYNMIFSKLGPIVKELLTWFMKTNNPYVTRAFNSFTSHHHHHRRDHLQTYQLLPLLPLLLPFVPQQEQLQWQQQRQQEQRKQKDQQGKP